MSITKFGLKLAAGVAATAFMATPAAAVVNVTSTGGPDTGPLARQSILLDFEGAAPAGPSGNHDLVAGSVANLYAAPLHDDLAARLAGPRLEPRPTS